MSDTGTGPVPAPESTHTPGPVFRDRGVIIHTLIAENERLKNARDGWMATLEELEARTENAEARIAELELACQRLRDDTQGARAERDQAKAETADLKAALTELAPSDEVLVEGSYFPRADLPRVLGNFMRASADYAREAKEGHRRAEAAEAETAALRARTEALADEWDAAVDARGGTTLAPVRFLARDLRAALAGAPAVTPTETQAEDGAADNLAAAEWFLRNLAAHTESDDLRGQALAHADDLRAYLHPAPVADPTTGETR